MIVEPEIEYEIAREELEAGNSSSEESEPELVSEFKHTVHVHELDAVSDDLYRARIISQDDLLLSYLTKYFEQNPKSVQRIVPIVNHESQVTLTFLDWLLSNYSRRHAGDNLELSLIWEKYNSQLRSFGKRRSDPFCRSDRFLYHIGEHSFVTNVRQLCFLKFSIESGVLDYVDQHFEELKKIYLHDKKKRRSDEEVR